MDKNGKALIRKSKTHINIWYFFITDRVDNGEVSVVLCPTGDIIGDYMTKPPQVAMFRKFRDQIMGVVSATDPVPTKFKVEQLRNS